MNAIVYDINFKKIIKWWTPLQICKTIWRTYLGVLVTPIAQLYQMFLLYREAILYDLMITSQVCYLEMMLRDRYDFTLRRIYITDALERPPLYLYQEAEDHPVYLYKESEGQPVYMYTDGEGGDYADDFIIMVPIDIVFDPVEMISLVMGKRLPGMRFTIQTF